MTPVTVGGVGVWAPGFAGARAWASRRADTHTIEPGGALLAPRLRRYTSQVTRMLVDALAEAAGQAGADLATTPALYGSAYGEIRTAVDLLAMIDAEGLPAPARFMNSVHNTAAGHVAIASGHTGFSTALAAGSATFAMCVLEALAWLDRHGGAILIAVGDEPLPDPLGAVARFEGLALALHLASGPDAPGAIATLERLRRQPGVVAPPVDDRFARNPSAAGLPLIEALLAGRGGVVPIEPPGAETAAAPWCVDVQPRARAPAEHAFRGGEGGGRA